MSPVDVAALPAAEQASLAARLRDHLFGPSGENLAGPPRLLVRLDDGRALDVQTAADDPARARLLLARMFDGARPVEMPSTWLVVVLWCALRRTRLGSAPTLRWLLRHVERVSLPDERPRAAIAPEVDLAHRLEVWWVLADEAAAAGASAIRAALRLDDEPDDEAADARRFDVDDVELRAPPWQIALVDVTPTRAPARRGQVAA